jgi:hypothetical protein
MTRCTPFLVLLLAVPLARAADPGPPSEGRMAPRLSRMLAALAPEKAPEKIAAPAPAESSPEVQACFSDCCDGRRLFESDYAFENFVGPISNPILTKDPRALTEFRILNVDNWIPHEHPLGGGDFQAYGFEVRVALTDRLSFIADKDGFASIHPHRGLSRTGALDIAAGLKYAVIRDPERQLLVTAGFQYEPDTGEEKVFQGHGAGTMTLFTSIGKGFGDCYVNHVIFNGGYQFPFDRTDNSTFFYTQLHLDRQLMGWLYPLVELNWFHWTDGGNRGIPPAIGEGDGLLNIGTSGVAGNDLVTVAGGVKAKIGRHLDTGVAFEFPISNRQDLLDYRLLAELILRY